MRKTWGKEKSTRDYVNAILVPLQDYFVWLWSSASSIFSQHAEKQRIPREEPSTSAQGTDILIQSDPFL